jgi:hypothetical protein
VIVKRGSYSGNSQTQGNCFICELERLTDRVFVYRIARKLEEDPMALEINGLKANAIAAAGHIERLRRAYAKLNEVAPAHAADVEGLANQVSGVADDIAFAATVLGNSAEKSEPTAAEPVGQEAEAAPATFRRTG